MQLRGMLRNTKKIYIGNQQVVFKVMITYVYV